MRRHVINDEQQWRRSALVNGYKVGHDTVTNQLSARVDNELRGVFRKNWDEGWMNVPDPLIDLSKIDTSKER